MRLCSTTDPGISLSFAEAVECGMADDGGLFMPARIPSVPPGFLQALGTMSFQETAFHVARLLLEGEIPDADLQRIVAESITFPAPLRRLDGDTAFLELFHGPTLAFKDFGARFMARTVSHLRKGVREVVTVLVATSGDTGSAVASGFHGLDGVRVVLLYPSGKVSALQEMQLTAAGGNVTAVAIDGTFDDCQRLVKGALADREISSARRLMSANSINVARLLPQSFYYFHAYGQLTGADLPVVFSVPCGNFGNLTAGLIAWKMGLPVKRFIAATNANDVVPRYLATGVYTPAPSVATISNAMDVGNPSNFARIVALFGGDLPSLRHAIYSVSFSDEETRGAIRDVYHAHGYVLDPHAAVAYLALQRYRSSEGDTSAGIVLETAHPAKFMDIYDDEIRRVIDVPQALRELPGGGQRPLRLQARPEELKAFLLGAKN